MKYIVMEVHPSYAVVLDEDGRFLKAANLHYKTGQTVTEIVEMKEFPEKKKKTTKLRYLMSGAAAAAACLLLLFTSVLSQSRQVYASVYLTINPEVRIDVNQKDRVVDLKAENEDGKTLLKGYSYKKKELDTVTEELVARAASMGFLQEGGRVTLSFDADDRVWIETHQKTLSGSLEESVKDGMKIIIEVTGKTAQPAQEPQEDTYGESDYGGSDEAEAEDKDEDESEESSDYGSIEEPENDESPEASSPYGSREDEETDEDNNTDDDTDDDASDMDGEDEGDSDSGYED